MHRRGQKTAEYLNRKACEECPNRDKCIKAKKGRVIVRGEYGEVLEKAIEKYKENKELYHKRHEIVEHPFGTIKRTLGFTYFLTRGLANVRTKNFLHVLTYNIKRLLSIFGPSLFPALSNMKNQEIPGKLIELVAGFCLMLRVKAQLLLLRELF